jgi:HSF-type DNA-binding
MKLLSCHLFLLNVAYMLHFRFNACNSWFRQTKLASFQRQLNIYGFQRLTTGRDKNGYFHEFFLRGKQFLAKKIQRNKIKGQGPRKPSSPDLEPNFYLMAPLPDIAANSDVESNICGLARSEKSTPVSAKEELSEKMKLGGGALPMSSMSSLGSILSLNNSSCALHHLLPDFGSSVNGPVGQGRLPQLLQSDYAFRRSLGLNAPGLANQASMNPLSSKGIASAIDRALLIAQTDAFPAYSHGSGSRPRVHMTVGGSPALYDSIGLLSGMQTGLSDYILGIQNR